MSDSAQAYYEQQQQQQQQYQYPQQQGYSNQQQNQYNQQQGYSNQQQNQYNQQQGQSNQLQNQYNQQQPEQYSQNFEQQAPRNKTLNIQYKIIEYQQPQSWYKAPTQVDYVKVGDMEFEARSGFVKKVYILLTLELAVTIGMTYAAMNTQMGSWLVTPELSVELTPFYYVCCVLSIIFQISLFCCPHNARKVPLNYILLVLYIVFFGFFLAGACQIVNILVVDGNIYVWAAWSMTLGLAICLTLYACTTKTDMTMKGGFIFCLVGPIIILAILSIFYFSKFLYIFLCSLIIILYGFYLIFETQLIMGGKKIMFSIDDYVIASLLLYGTIIQLFIRILEIILLSRK